MKDSSVRQMMNNEARKTLGATVGIPPRLMAFPAPDGVPVHPFFDENALASSLFAVLSAVFPPGERFFVESVRHFRRQVKDDKLKAAVSGFIGQEAIHGREHERLNEWFEANGYDIRTADRMIRLGLGLLEKLPASQQLACTNFMEHFTALLAEQWLKHDVFRRTTDPEMIKLWTWHALEELEHKWVAFDVHQAVSDNAYRERMLAVPLVLVALTPGILFSWVWIAARQPARFDWREHRRGLKAMFGEGGFFTKVFAHVPDYFRRGFHPDEHDTTALEQQWRDKLFGNKGELRRYWQAAVRAG